MSVVIQRVFLRISFFVGRKDDQWSDGGYLSLQLMLFVGKAAVAKWPLHQFLKVFVL